MYVLLAFVVALGAFSPAMAQRKKKKNRKTQVQLKALSPAERAKVDRLYVDACTQMIRGDLRAAETQFEEVLSLDPQNHAANYNLAKLALEQRNYARAITYGNIALEQNSSSYWYARLVQQAYSAQGNLRRAAEVQQSLIPRSPQALEDHLLLATLYERMGEEAQALEYLESLSATFGPRESIEQRKLQLYKKRGNFKEALASTEALLGMYPLNEDYVQERHQLLVLLGRETEALKRLQEVVTLDPNNGFALLKLADYYKSIDDIATSDKYLYRAFANPEIPPEDKADIVQQLLNYVDQEESVAQRVKKLTHILTETHPSSGEIYTLRAESFLIDGQADSASLYFRKSLELEPGQPSIWERMLRGAYRLSNDRQLRDDAEEALEFFPNQLSFLYYFGHAAAMMGDERAADYALGKILKIATDPIWVNRAKASYGYLKLQEEREEGLALLEEALARVAEEDPYVVQTYAHSMVEIGQKLDLARKMMDKVIKDQPQVPRYQATYGWLLFRLGKLQGAEAWLQRAATRTNNPLVWEQYGDVLHELGQDEAARTYWQKAIDAGARHLNIQQKLQNQ